MKVKKGRGRRVKKVKESQKYRSNVWNQGGVETRRSSSTTKKTKILGDFFDSERGCTNKEKLKGGRISSKTGRQNRIRTRVVYGYLHRLQIACDLQGKGKDDVGAP